MKLRASILSLLMTLSLAGFASAAPTYCSAVAPLDSNADGVTTGDLTFRGNDADDCYGIVAVQGGNNDSLTKLNDELIFGGGWEVTLKDENADGVLLDYLGLTWTVSSPNTGQSGNWTLTVSDFGAPGGYTLPVVVDIVGVLKAGNDWAAYLFEAESFNVLGVNNGTFQFSWTGSGLSHLSLYLREVDLPPPPPPPDVPVPEPASLLLLGTGLVAVAAGARRRMRK